MSEAVSAICIDGPMRGRIWCASGDTIQYYRPVERRAVFMRYEDLLLDAQAPACVGTYHLHTFRVGERLYRGWSSKISSPDAADAVLALIDADPADAELVRVR